VLHEVSQLVSYITSVLCWICKFIVIPNNKGF